MSAAQRHFELIQGTILFYRHVRASPVTKMPRTEKSHSCTRKNPRQEMLKWLG
jgi:hypothetical protein